MGEQKYCFRRNMIIEELNKKAKEISDLLIEILPKISQVSEKHSEILNKQSKTLIVLLRRFEKVSFTGDYRYELGRVIGRIEALAKILYRLSKK